MSDMSDTNVIAIHLEKYQIILKRHHSPAGCVAIGRISFRQNFERVACIEQACDIFIGSTWGSRFCCYKKMDARKIATTPWSVDDSHRSPSCIRICSLLRPSPRSNSASASVSAERISEISSDENLPVIKSAIPHWIFIQSSCGMAATVLITSCAVID